MKDHAHRIREELPLIIFFIATIWGVFLLDQFLPLESFGLIPRSFSGLTGIIAMPFLHGSLGHIMSNTVPLIVLMLLLAGSKANSRLIMVAIIILGGVLLWLFGRGASLHIGASGLVFGLAVFLMVSGFLERRTVPVIVALIVAFLYGSSLISGIMPFQRGVSWDGHLFGGLAGAFVAWVMARHLKSGG
ncbi:MAG: rhomboid family intramembrane serine protease [Thiothrix nivea]|nr:MAG: rhomboid family intramembrane serine protease [Thiothrix nivea]